MHAQKQVKSGAGRLVLAVDLGGTNASFAVVRAHTTQFQILERVVLPSNEQPSFTAALGAAVKALQARTDLVSELSACCVSAAGPVTNGVCRLTNLPYSLDTGEIEQLLKLPSIIINDFEAICYGIPLLDLDDPQQVRPVLIGTEQPQPRYGVASVLGAGTGLGMGYLSWAPPELHVYASEGGHLDFAPWDDSSAAFAAYLRATLGRTPEREDAVSGPAIARAYSFLLSDGRIPENGVSRRILALEETRRPAAIAEAAAGVYPGPDPGCEAAMKLFAALYGRQCSASVLQHLPHYGVFLAGGVTAKNEAFLAQSPEFAAAFLDGYSAHLRAGLLSTPIYIIRDYQISLLGAAHAIQHRMTNTGHSAKE